MSISITPGGARPFSTRLNQGDNALTAPTTPGNRLPVIDKTKIDPQELKAAQGMEALFLDEMLKAMRKTVPKEDMDLEGPATAIYREMQDEQFAERSAHAGGVGLADQIVAYLESQRYTLPRGQGVPQTLKTAHAATSGAQGARKVESPELQKDTGGTAHESR